MNSVDVSRLICPYHARSSRAKVAGDTDAKKRKGKERERCKEEDDEEIVEIERIETGTTIESAAFRSTR